MGRYSGNPAAINALVQPTQVHRDVYIDEEVFELEMKHLFANAWVFSDITARCRTRATISQPRSASSRC